MSSGAWNWIGKLCLGGFFMLRSTFSFGVAGVLLMTALPTFAALPLDGWNGYKFGMSPDQARAVPGVVFGKYSAKDLQDRDIGAMSAQQPVRMNGIAFSLDFIFEPPKKLSRISLENQVTTTQPACETRFIGMLSFLEKTYGGFAPINPQRPKEDDRDQLPSTVEWKSQAGLHYQVTTVPLANETGHVWSARKTDSKHSINVSATWSAKDGDTGITCLMNVDFDGK
jgi:hypothetical protein